MKKQDGLNTDTSIFGIRNWRLRSQILVIQLCFLILSTTSVVCLILQGQYKIIDLISNDSIYILQSKIMSRQSMKIQQQYIQQLLQGFFDGEQAINSLQILFTFISDKNFVFNYNLENCSIFDDSIISTELQEVQNSFCVCYGVAGEASNKQIYQDKQILGNLFNQLEIMLKQQYQIYYASNTDDQFYSIYPCQFIPSDWIPKLRPWYQSHNQNSSKVQVSDVYLEMDYGICFTQTQTLYNINKQAVGILANDITMSQFKIYNDFIPVNFTVIDKNGRIMLSPIYLKEEKEILYFYNSSKIGYDYNDYQTLLNFYNNEEYLNICPFQVSKTFCLFNQIEGIVKYLSLGTIPNLEFLVITEYDPNLYISNLDIFLSQIQNTKATQINVLIGIIIISFGLVFISFLINTIILQKPLEKLLYYAHIVNKSQRIKYMKQPKFSNSNVIGNLNVAFFNFLNQQNYGKEENEELARLQHECGQEYLNRQYSKKFRLKKNTLLSLIDLNLFKCQQTNSNIDALLLQQCQKLRQIVNETLQNSEKIITQN